MAIPVGNLSEEQQAAQIGISVRTLRRWRARGYGPAVTQTGRAISYTPAAGPEWVASQQKKVELPSPRRRAA
ncbi:MAG TPA: hypothetical protein VKQ73_02025 [Stellaceae bacterium]|nr:hypothetical protein [Stellaceae bacterium]